MKEIILRISIIIICVFCASFLFFSIFKGKSDETSDSVAVFNANKYTSETETTTTASVLEIITETTTIQTEAETKTEIVTEQTEFVPEKSSVRIEVENILQNPELPVGCEITSLAILLNFYGFEADKTVLAKDYLPLGGGYEIIAGELHKDSFYDYFIGDPFTRGYGCFSSPIEKSAKAFLSDNSSELFAENISGAEAYELYEYLLAGTPVLCWITDGVIPPEYHESWYDSETGQKLDWHFNEHCVVLCGADFEKGLVLLSDSMKGEIFYDMKKFEKRYRQMGSQAIVISKP